MHSKLLLLAAAALKVAHAEEAVSERSFGKNAYDLGGSDGKKQVEFVGITWGDYAGWSVSNAGDVNNDGYDDALIGAPDADTNAGQTYLVFGGTNIESDGSMALDDLDGSNGFVIKGESSYDYAGYSVSGAGDVNNDGYADILVGAYGHDSNSMYSNGACYVIFGSSTVGSSGTINVEDLTGSDGFVITGAASYDYVGKSVGAAGDFNNDGYDDILIGAYGADGAATGAGEAYLVYGSASVGSSGSLEISALDGSNGFVINGETSTDYLGFSVSSAGDFNNDNYDDIIVGAYLADPTGGTNAGSSYLIFGGASIASSGSLDVSALTGSDGFSINGDSAGDYSGYSVSGGGDFNGDDYADVIIGAYLADNADSDTEAGGTYILYGGSTVGSSGSIDVSDLSGSDGFVIDGQDAYDNAGLSVSNAGDVNGDGYDDVIIGAPDAESSSGIWTWYYSTGESYVVLGGESVATSGTFDLTDLDGSNGYRLDGENSYDYSGHSVSGGGDFNNDGYADVIVGAYYGGTSAEGRAYIIMDPTKKGSPSAAAILGIIIGCVVGGICLIALSIFACVKCCCNKQEGGQNNEVQMAQPAK